MSQVTPVGATKNPGPSAFILLEQRQPVYSHHVNIEDFDASGEIVLIKYPGKLVIDKFITLVKSVAAKTVIGSALEL